MSIAAFALDALRAFKRVLPVNFVRVCIVVLLVSFGLSYVRTLLELFGIVTEPQMAQNRAQSIRSERVRNAFGTQNGRTTLGSLWAPPGYPF